ncbi:MAG: ArsR family transcriptional regulator [Candidatus Bathyarchaeia archaeon]|jgi:DNA-binding transcriptional ArsR family regulator
MEGFSNEAYYLFFSTLANRTRLAIIDVLREGPKNISGISTALEQEETIIAHNLKVLERSALLRSESYGKEKLYSLNMEVFAPLSELLTFHTNTYCPNLKSCIPPEKLEAYMKKEAAKETFIEHQ